MKDEIGRPGTAEGTESDEESTGSGRLGEHAHTLDPISLALGLIFAVAGGVFLFGDVNATDASPTWLAVSLFGAAGVILIAMGLRGRN